MQAMLLFRDEGVDWSQLATAEAKQALYQRMIEWTEKLERAGKLVAVDGLKGGGKTVRRKGAGLVVDGPYAEGRDAVLGFYILEVADLDEALAFAQESPHATVLGGATEVREINPFRRADRS
jgi:hypothetical protein